MPESFLPQLREDLVLIPGPALADGSPTWTLQDPVRNQFFRLGRREFEILARWALGAGEAVVHAIARETTLRVTPTDVQSMVSFLSANLLLGPGSPGSLQLLKSRMNRKTQGMFHWLLTHYLFIRIPLWHPDRFLDATLPVARHLMTRGFLYFLLVSGLLGLFLVGRQWEAFTHAFLQFFTFQGILFYGLAIFLAKLIHEFGHAYTAKRYGVRVPTMGVAFLVLFPMLYSDTSESWKVKNSKARMAIVAAGVLSELALAVLAILSWNFLDDGPLRSACFIIGTITWVTSLGLNLSPFMRFDGYYLLSDFLEVPNLHERSFALGKWALGKSLLGVDRPCPEKFSLAKTRFLIGFAVATWIYRLLLFAAIALLVYHFFFKALGVVLFCVEITWFIVLPVWKEMKGLWQQRGSLSWNPRLIFTLALLSGLLAFVFLPQQSPVYIPALLKPAAMAGIYPPFSARIKEIRVTQGQRVQKGEVLFVLKSPELEFREKAAQSEVLILEEQLRRQINQYDLMEQIHIIERRLASAQTRLQGYQAQKFQLWIRSPNDGRITDVAENLDPGLWINERHRLAGFMDTAGLVVEGYVKEQWLEGLEPGQTARFYPEAPLFSPVDCTLVDIDSASTRTLDRPDLTSIYKGEIFVSPSGGTTPWAVRETVYRVVFAPVLAMEEPDHLVRGMVRVKGKSQSLFSASWRRIQAVFIRESGF